MLLSTVITACVDESKNIGPKPPTEPPTEPPTVIPPPTIQPPVTPPPILPPTVNPVPDYKVCARHGTEPAAADEEGKINVGKLEHFNIQLDYRSYTAENVAQGSIDYYEYEDADDDSIDRMCLMMDRLKLVVNDPRFDERFVSQVNKSNLVVGHNMFHHQENDKIDVNLLLEEVKNRGAFVSYTLFSNDRAANAHVCHPRMGIGIYTLPGTGSDGKQAPHNAMGTFSHEMTHNMGYGHEGMGQAGQTGNTPSYVGDFFTEMYLLLDSEGAFQNYTPYYADTTVLVDVEDTDTHHVNRVDPVWIKEQLQNIDSGAHHTDQYYANLPYVMDELEYQIEQREIEAQFNADYDASKDDTREELSGDYPWQGCGTHELHPETHGIRWSMAGHGWYEPQEPL